MINIKLQINYNAQRFSALNRFSHIHSHQASLKLNVWNLFVSYNLFFGDYLMRIFSFKSKFFMTIGLGLLCNTLLYTQETSYPYEEERYSFINYDLNLFCLFEDSSSFHRLYKKYGDIVTKGKGQLKIVHIGGSHIQADIYSNRMRQRMASFCYGSNGGRGFLFPYKIAKTNNPWNYKVSYSGEWSSVRNVERNTTCNLGISGITVFTNDSLSSISISTRDYKNIHYDFNRLQLFCNTDSTGYMIKLTYPNDVLHKEICHNGYIEYVFNELYDSLHFQFILKDASKNDFELYGIYLGNDDAGIVYNAIGVNGARLGSFLKCNLFDKQLITIDPDWVIISLGTNDANTDNFQPEYYQSNYAQLITRIKKALPNAAILLTVPNDSFLHHLYINPNTEKAREIVFSIAKKFNCGIWDLYEIMGGFESCNTWYDYGLMKQDHVHFTVTGYVLKGDLFFNAFLNGFNEYIDTHF